MVWTRLPLAPQLLGTPSAIVGLMSIWPLQSLSSPSQISVLGLTLRLHAIAPLVQAVVPGAQTPACPVLQAAPPPGLPLSTAPLQLLSRPSQVSAPGFWLRLQT